MTGKRKTFSNNEKCSLLKAYDKLPKTSQREAVAKLGIPQATFCTLIKQRDTVMNPALVKWIDHAWSRNAAPSVPLVREKAESLATTQEDSFKRENIVFKKLHGEAAEWVRMRQAYSEESICNADETRIYFRALPDALFALRTLPVRYRKSILLPMDNCTAHNVKTLRNVRLESLLKKTTSILQLCDQGIIIRTAKAYFRKEKAHSVLRQIDEGNRAVARDVTKKISLLDMIRMLRDAWADVGASTIRNCWRKGGLVMSPEEEPTPVNPLAEITTRCFNVGTSAASSEEEEDEEEETVVPSRAEMRNAVCILKTGLLHIGFKNFDLLHHFEKEVNLVLKNTLIQGTMDKYVK
uniref:DDE-1 domain-containing protein n=1 Tax=Cyprinodon variegatus TaxID=28743 RepID=A0A3Q2CCY6_CYPVA